MAAPTVNTANSNLSYDAGATSHTLSSFALSAGSDRLLEVWVINGGAAGAAAPTGVTWGGVAMTARGNHTNPITTFRQTKWYIKEANFPSGATGDIVASWAGSQGCRGITAIGYNGVNQTSPYRNASETTAIDYDQLTPDIAVSSNTADLAAAAVLVIQPAANLTAVSVTAGTQQTESAIASSAVCTSGATVAGASTSTIEWTYDGTAVSSAGMMIGDSLQEAPPPITNGPALVSARSNIRFN